MNPIYNREIELQERFNNFIVKITGVELDYYSGLLTEDFVNIKTTLSDLNNIITYRTTIRFMEWLSDQFPYVKDNYNVYIDQVLGTKPSDNGFDIVVNGDVKILAEVKCNKPINNGFKFGSAQRNGLIKDIKGLMEGKTKVKNVDHLNSFKFLVVYDYGEHTLRATEHLIKNLPSELKGKVVLLEEHTELTVDKVYIVFIK
jgi:hypothetical protein